jgi:hypothetical protein
VRSQLFVCDDVLILELHHSSYTAYVCREKRDQFEAWWKEHDITGKYGYEWGKKTERNGFIRLGQQVCNPPSDCDLPWFDLIDMFAETPIVYDITFSTVLPYGEAETDLRFLYPGDIAVLRQHALHDTTKFEPDHAAGTSSQPEPGSKFNSPHSEL